ncbi:potassium channel family protein [Pasteurella skyensis]|uniref:Potassium channel family protein n=1 Tax=Phocoenobacter skyensis TaxID=97481 RepID=A0AAJ6NAP5_9PAST|nr:potassium channel family protein [Pasteurella skyensis]MDP8163215.1 potassium channel family protein [Pasteurella skyensis]MDP8173318.1 potassium channel family protein [Pasteurella skyensis]MDP8176977.1 potassium channel family protein [Pasteurella skyensis]MDP8179728.1 potassium channel family protein [Pasteurella skyensis]MDP8182679.1 potassium channel family protein [Pasteurella skyensis]
MISFFINGYRLLKIIISGLKTDEEFRFLFIFIILLLIGANIFYVKIEQWSIIDALYFSVMTMATVGYGDLTPTTDISKLFTIVYTFLSIGAFVSFTAKCVHIMLINHQTKQKHLSKHNKS